MTIGDFSKQADAYTRARPSYPDALLDSLISDLLLQRGDRVADLGAGTGIFTRLLVARGFEVTAVDPNDEMMRRALVPKARWVKGTFEDNSLPNRSQSWAVAAQAFHWAEPAIALPQVRRILRPNGVFTVLWNDRANQDCEVLQWTAAAIARHVAEFDEAYRDRKWNDVLESTGDFTFLSQHTVRHSVTMSRERYLDLWRSHNRLNNVAGTDRFARFFGELTEYLEHHQIEHIDLPYNCVSWSARRID